MKFTTSLSAIQNALQKVLPALPRKSTLPVLEHLHFSLHNDALQILATDQDITIQTNIEIEGEVGGAILIPGRKLVDIVKALGTEGSIEFETNEDNYEITILSHNPVGRYTLKGLDASEFLKIPELIESAKPKVDSEGKLVKDANKDVISFKKKDINYISSKSVYAVSTDEFRPAMNGVLFQFRSTYLNAVATDSFRLVKVIQRTEEGESYPEDLDVIIPARTMDVLKKVDSDVIVSFIEARGKKTHIRFDFKESVFISRLINENFPPYESVIPNEQLFKLMFKHSDFQAAVNRVSIMTSEVYHQIRVHIENDTFTLTGQDEDTGAHAMETLSCNYQDEHFEIAFNVKYLKDAIDNLSSSGDDKIEVRFTEPNRPVIFKPDVDNDDIIMLIMPVRFK